MNNCAVDHLNSLILNKQFTHVYQPIVRFGTGEVHGYEALLRSEEFMSPEEFFQQAKDSDLLYELDIASITNAIVKGNDTWNIFINVYPSTLCHNSFEAYVDSISALQKLHQREIIFEINETEEIDVSILFDVITYMQKKGFKIALDDIGRGISPFEKLLDLKPDYIKLDRYFAHAIDAAPKKQHMLKLLVNYCHEESILLILEGIENEKELITAKALGVPFGQGYLLGKPLPIDLLSQI